MRRRSPVACFATIASPLAGMRSAAMGVRSLPIPVPSWRDVADDSSFIAALYSVPLGESVRYLLIHAHEADAESDGVVPTTSQLRAEATNEAERVIESLATHTGVLQEADVVSAIASFASSCASTRAADESEPSDRAH